MAIDHQVEIIKSGVDNWNRWKSSHPTERVDLTDADLSGAVLPGAYLAEAWLTGVNFRGANLTGAFLRDSDLNGANLTGTDCRETKFAGSMFMAASFEGAMLQRADLSRTKLFHTNLRNADLTGARLEGANLIGVDVEQAILEGCNIYGLAVWDLDGVPTRQSGLIITSKGEPVITVDDIEVAQFVYLLLNNRKIRGVIDAIGRKGVLILGRFYGERKAVLDALRERLPAFDLVPIVFDFDKPSHRDLTETVQLLANMSRFVIADVTDAKSIPQELSHIIPSLPSVPVRPIILDGEYEYSMFEHWKPFKSVLDVYRYKDRDQLLANIEAAIIEPVREWERDFDQQKGLREKNQQLETRVRELEARLAKAGGA
jgi:hypothetical protein